MTGPRDKQGSQFVLIPSRKVVRGTDATFAQRHVHLMEFLPLVTEALGRKRKGEKSVRAERMNELKGRTRRE
jgi:hypothetical protein